MCYLRLVSHCHCATEAATTGRCAAFARLATPACVCSASPTSSSPDFFSPTVRLTRAAASQASHTASSACGCCAACGCEPCALAGAAAVSYCVHDCARRALVAAAHTACLPVSLPASLQTPLTRERFARRTRLPELSDSVSPSLSHAPPAGAAVLNEDRFLARVGFGYESSRLEPPSVKKQIITLLHAMRVLLTIPLMLLNVIVIVLKVIMG